MRRSNGPNAGETFLARRTRLDTWLRSFLRTIMPWGEIARDCPEAAGRQDSPLKRGDNACGLSGWTIWRWAEMRAGGGRVLPMVKTQHIGSSKFISVPKITLRLERQAILLALPGIQIDAWQSGVPPCQHRHRGPERIPCWPAGRTLARRTGPLKHGTAACNVKSCKAL